ncbi:helix-turn-helix domain-containing protein [Pontibacter sp. MBLB2868]|uniref:helix-turn-helix domain-containing protein n=1 Tax=Pontibacter sp. MBLB2868 TaxID=3451555 RepID=UPI003F751F0B
MSNLNRKLEDIMHLLQSQTLSSKTIFNVPEAAQYMDLSEDAVYKLAAARKLRHSKPGGKRVYIERAECDRYLRLNTIRRVDEIEEEASAYIKTRRKSC